MSFFNAFTPPPLQTQDFLRKTGRVAAGLSVFCALCAVFSCSASGIAEFPGGGDAPPEVFKITPSEFSLKTGDSWPLSYTGQPFGTESVAWFSDSASATVDSAGSVTGVGAGLAVITAKALNSSGSELASAESRVTVGDETIIPTAFIVVPSSVSLSVNETKALTTENLPYGATLSWSSNAASVATVDAASGVVTAKGAGEAVITATARQGGSTLKTASCTVTVLSPTQFKINPATLTIITGSSATLAVQNLPGETASLEWGSSAQGYATVANAGSGSAVVTAVSAGQAAITATAKNASGTVLAAATCAVTVTAPPPFKIDQGNLTLSTNGATTTLTTSNAPSGTASVAWSSGTPSVLTVNASTGLITVVGGPGSVTITAKAMPASGAVPIATATCTVTVTATAPPGPDADTLAVLVQSGTTTEIYLKTPAYTLANVISTAVGSATAGTEAAPSKIKLIAGKTYTINAAIVTGTNKHLQISTYSSGTATINRNAKTYAIIEHTSGTLVLGDGVAANKVVLDGGGGDANLTHKPLLYHRNGGTVTLKDGVEITGGTFGGAVSAISTNFYMEGGVIRGNKTPSFGGGICINGGTFNKTGGTIYGNDGTPNANTAGGGGIYYGHAVLYTPNSNLDSSTKQRNTTAGPTVNLDSSNGTNWGQ